MGQRGSHGVPCTGSRADVDENISSPGRPHRRSLCGVCGHAREKRQEDLPFPEPSLPAKPKPSDSIAPADPLFLVSAQEVDGGTGGTGSESRGAMRSCHLECASHRGTEQDSLDSQQVLFGNKALAPKLKTICALDAEAGVLRQTRNHIAERLDAIARHGVPAAAFIDALAAHKRPAVSSSVPSALTAALEPALKGDQAEIAEMRDELGLTTSEWVEWFFMEEDATKGVPAGWLSEILSDLFGTSLRTVRAREVESRYAEILEGLARMACARHDAINFLVEKFDHEVKEIEELICVCFEKMDKAGEDAVPSEQFVKLVCGCRQRDEASAYKVSPTDAARLFSQMSKGKDVITYEEFKDEITQGCLQILRGNIALRSSMLKRYRDYWF